MKTKKKLQPYFDKTYSLLSIVLIGSFILGFLGIIPENFYITPFYLLIGVIVIAALSGFNPPFVSKEKNKSNN